MSSRRPLFRQYPVEEVLGGAAAAAAVAAAAAASAAARVGDDGDVCDADGSTGVATGSGNSRVRHRRETRGRLTDFLDRMRGTVEKTTDLAIPGNAHLVALDVGTCDHEELVMAVQECTGFRLDVEMLRRECLETGLMSIVTHWYRDRRDPRWLASPTAVFKKYGKAIMAERQNVAAHTAELDVWMQARHLAQQLKNSNVREEAPPEWKSQFDLFWDEFHRGQRKGDPAAPVKRFGSKARAGSKRPSVRIPSKVAALSPLQAFAKDLSIAGGQSHCKLGMNDMRWKIRPAIGPTNAYTLSQSFDEEKEGGLSLGKRSAHVVTMQRAADEHQRVVNASAPVGSGRRASFSAFLDQMTSAPPGNRRGSGASKSAKQAKQPSASASALTPASDWQKKLHHATSLPNVSFGAAGGSRSRRTSGLGAATRGSIGAADATAATSSPTSTLPPVVSVSRLPHSSSLAGRGRTDDVPMKRYLRACDEDSTVPMPTPFVTGLSPFLKASGQGLRDEDLTAISATAKGMGLTEIDLAENCLLSDEAVARFLEVLFTPPTSQKLTRVSLRLCVGAGKRSLDTMGRLLLDRDYGLTALQILDLGGIPMTMKAHEPLCHAVANHSTLRTVSLVNTGLGNNGAARRIISELLGSQSINSLDLSWNCFSVDVFTHIGKRVVEVGALQTLRLANCSASASDDGPSTSAATPIVYFLEQMARDYVVTELDISMNRIDFQAALVLEDALSNSSKLRRLNISDNPLGVLGMRSLLRLLTRRGSGLLLFHCEDCFTGSRADDAQGPCLVFSDICPGGRFELEFHRPYHRSFLRMLYKKFERLKMSPGEAFSDCTPPLHHPDSKDVHGVWPVPTSGSAALTFTIDKALETMTKGVDEWDFSRVLSVYNGTMRLQPAFQKVIPLLAQWVGIDGRTFEQTVMIEALSTDFLLNFPQLYLLAQSQGVVTQAISSLLPCLGGSDLSRYLSLVSVHSVGCLVSILRRSQAFFGFSADSPTGHYVLDLANPMDRYVAESLLTLDRWEFGIAKRNGYPDVSEKGNMSNCRNVRFQHRPLHVDVKEWNIPEQDIFELDYATRHRPRADQAPLDNSTVSSLMRTAQADRFGAWSLVEAFRVVSRHIHVTSSQLRRLLSLVCDASRLEIVVTFFFRVVDMQNEKVFRSALDREEDVVELRQRLGYMTFYPFIQPEYATFELDCAKHDQRMAANMIIVMAIKERWENMKDAAMVNADGTDEEFVMGVPRGWEVLANMPREGVFSCRYVCSPDDRAFKERRRCFGTYGLWASQAESFTEPEVRWCVALREAPPDVISYLYFTRARFSSVVELFKYIDGPEGNGVISARELEDSVKAMNCENFKGATEKKRIEGIFRFFDPHGDGEITSKSFHSLDLLWNENLLCIREFAEFFSRAPLGGRHTAGCGAADAWWKALDPEGRGEIKSADWRSAVERSGYFGVAEPLLAYLDDGGGPVTLDKLRRMEAVLPVDDG
eukprot:TRINITY_DN30169_c0_g1_i1.p1 TRINITY_DN30169_c0_g1~~TRINITY_DN30169_c0_g1_i1.p1  ORF type:complete len:1479 (-),score=279.44 TRINITY_DN30169_c0_g1_i1:135-4571(-)